MEKRQPANRQTSPLSFTLFVILPTEDVCSLRNLISGVTIREIRCRLELMAGIPAQIYRLVCADDAALHEDHELVLERNVWDGFIVRMQLYESWTRLYKSVLAGDVESVVNNGAVHYRNQKLASLEEEDKFKTITRERGFVALFMASYHGHVKMCKELLTHGVDVNLRTPFHRTSLHAAVSRDQHRVMDVLIQHGGSIDAKDVIGDTGEMVARKCFAKECMRKLRILKLQGVNGLVPAGAEGLSRAVGRTMLQPVPPTGSLPLRSNTASKARLVKRHTVANVSSKTLPISVSEEAPLEVFMWDTDNSTSRAASASKFRLGLPHSIGMPRISTANSKPGVTWDVSTLRSPSCNTPDRYKTPHQPILKNRGHNRGTPRISISRDGVKRDLVSVRVPLSDPSEQGSQLSVASAPGPGLEAPGTNSDTRSVESAPDLQPQARVDITQESRGGTARKPRTRLLVSRHRTTESWRTMKRRIQMAESKKKLYGEERQRKRETFEEWLNRKRKQGKRDSRETDSEDSETDSDVERGNSAAFREWLREQRERKIVRPQTVTVADLYRRQTRPLKGLVTVTDPPDVNLDPNENMFAHKKWRDRRISVGEGNSNDIKTQKKRLEEKRQQLMARAVSYDEWMEHTEDRKQLMQRILNANMAELERIENERLKKRTSKQISYSQWSEKTEKKDAMEKAMRERQRVQKEEENRMRMESRNSASVPHDVWMKKKEEQRKQKIDKEKENVQKVMVTRGDSTLTFDSWLEKKHKGDLTDIKSQIQRERDMIKVLRDRRVASVTSC